MDSLAGRTVGPYQILEQIGAGGMATVYKAYQPSLERYVAIKVLPPQFARQPGFAQRFRREARAVAHLEHPHILPVYDHGQEGDLSYLVMRYIEAGTLKEQLGRPLELPRISELVGQIAQALDHAHQQGVIHRDVKPSNVLLDRGRWALLTDFGVARMLEGVEALTADRVGVGTPAYMSPEQGQGQRVDRRSDVYSLGVVLYEMLTGRVPYEAETPLAVVLKHVNDPLPRPRQANPEVAEGVERVVLKALAKSPEDRYQTAGELANALRAEVEETALLRLQAGEAGEAKTQDVLTPPSSADIPRRSAPDWLRRLWPAALALGAIGLLVLVLLLRPPEPEPTPAPPPEPSPTAANLTPTDSALSPTATTVLVEPTEPAAPTPSPLPIASNDDFADAIAIETLPFNISLDTTTATLEEDEPQECPLGEPFMQKTVWYRFTPETTMALILEGDTDLDVAVVVYAGSSLDSLVREGCSRAGGQWVGPMSTIFVGGRTYYLQVGGTLGATGELTFSAPEASEGKLTPPENDNFADAIVIDELPFTISLNTGAATRETEEPHECPGGEAFMQKTVWYRFTPETTMGLDIEGNTDLEIGIVPYTGLSLNSLTGQGCFGAGGQWQGTLPTTFVGGTTYHLQVGGPLGAKITLTFMQHE